MPTLLFTFISKFTAKLILELVVVEKVFQQREK
jgi:hypothetical protein